MKVSRNYLSVAMVLLVFTTGFLAGCESKDNGGSTGDTSNPSAPDISYSPDLRLLMKNKPMEPMLVLNKAAKANSYSISGELPAGLKFDALTGEISGTPSALSYLAAFNVTARNAAGSSNHTIYLGVVDQSPIVKYQPEKSTLLKGFAIQPLVPQSTGGAALHYSVEPVLPEGLSIDEDTGTISGTPAVVSAQMTYVTVAENSGGTNYARLTLTVNDLPPRNFSYAGSSYAFVRSTAITDVVPAITGGAIERYSVFPELPSGLSLNAMTGVISGTPAQASGSRSYTVTASNTGGTVNASFSMSVTEPPPPPTDGWFSQYCQVQRSVTDLENGKKQIQYCPNVAFQSAADTNIVDFYDEIEEFVTDITSSPESKWVIEGFEVGFSSNNSLNNVKVNHKKAGQNGEFTLAYYYYNSSSWSSTRRLRVRTLSTLAILDTYRFSADGGNSEMKVQVPYIGTLEYITIKLKPLGNVFGQNIAASVNNGDFRTVNMSNNVVTYIGNINDRSSSGVSKAVIPDHAPLPVYPIGCPQGHDRCAVFYSLQENLSTISVEVLSNYDAFPPRSNCTVKVPYRVHADRSAPRLTLSKTPVNRIGNTSYQQAPVTLITLNERTSHEGEVQYTLNTPEIRDQSGGSSVILNFYDPDLTAGHRYLTIGELDVTCTLR